MANPKISTLTDLFSSQGFGLFGFGDGGFGGTYPILNPQWNTNSGSYGFDPIQLKPYVDATNTPSYVGAALYDLEQSRFFAKITPAAGSNVQTGLLIRFDRTNYAEISYGPNGQFNAYVSNNTVITTASMPMYDPVDHAYWRIRNDDPLNIFFDTSPDGDTWTEQGFAPFNWDLTSVTVTIFAGFTELDGSGGPAYITNINLPANNLELSGSVFGAATVSGAYTLTDPNALSGSANGLSNLSGSFVATLGIPEGGLTDFAYTTYRTIDPQMLNIWDDTVSVTTTGTSPLTQAAWTRTSNPGTYPASYRDGSYWPATAYTELRHQINDSDSAHSTVTTNVQLEKTIGISNRLSLDASIYDTACMYSADATVLSVYRSTELPLTGQYSGKMTSRNATATFGDGTLGYFPLPLSGALTAVKQSGGTVEKLFGTVAFSTTRANTTWFASFIFYDVNFNILSASTYQQVSITNKNTHPGGGIWQTGAVFASSIPTTAIWAAVVPAVNVSSATVETTYMSNHSITGASLFLSETPTTFSAPRTANINVKADRVNYVLNSGFNTSINQWFIGSEDTTGSPNPMTAVWDNAEGYNSLGSLRVDCATISGTFTGPSTATVGVATRAVFSSTTTSRVPIVQGLKIGHTYTLSAWVKQGENCPDIFMRLADANEIFIAESTNDQKITNPEQQDGLWMRVQKTFTVPETAMPDYGMYFYVQFPDLANAPFSFWIDSILLEETNTYNGYFDGGFASADYKWEFGGTANLARSYYYKDYNNKFVRLNDAIPSVLPVGESYNLLFAQPIT